MVANVGFQLGNSWSNKGPTMTQQYICHRSANILTMLGFRWRIVGPTKAQRWPNDKLYFAIAGPMWCQRWVSVGEPLVHRWPNGEFNLPSLGQRHANGWANGTTTSKMTLGQRSFPTLGQRSELRRANVGPTKAC